MRTARWSMLAIILLTEFVIADPPATAPANPLIGTWKILSIGKKPIPKEIRIEWRFDQTHVETIADGQVLSKSAYELTTQGDQKVVAFTPVGQENPARVGLYEFKDGKLRIQVTVETGKPPEKWNEDEVMLMEPVAAE